MDQMQKYEALNQTMDRIKVLMDASNKSMEELIGYGAVCNVDCANCPISELCDDLKYFDCSEIWTKYIKGEIG